MAQTLRGSDNEDQVDLIVQPDADEEVDLVVGSDDEVDLVVQPDDKVDLCLLALETRSTRSLGPMTRSPRPRA